jgi:hypothetical protein
LRTFDNAFFKEETFDFCGLQSALYQPTLTLDPVQQEYWEAMGLAGRCLSGDQPTEGNVGLLVILAALRAAGLSVGIVDFHPLGLIRP